MKVLRFIETALSVTMLCAGFTACSDNDGSAPREDAAKVQKYIKSRTFSYKGSHNETLYSAEAFYDENNRLVSIREECTSKDNYGYQPTEGSSFTIDYASGTMISTNKVYGEDDRYSFKLNDKGHVTELVLENKQSYQQRQNEKVVFTYDGEGHLKKSEYTADVTEYGNQTGQVQAYTTITEHEWKNGNLVNIVTTTVQSGFVVSKGKTYYKYTNIFNKGNIQPYYGCYDSGLWEILYSERIADILFSSGLFGNLSNYLPTVIGQTEENNNYNGYKESDLWESTYQYTLDSDGFVIKITSQSDGEEKTGTFFYQD